MTPYPYRGGPAIVEIKKGHPLYQEFDDEDEQGHQMKNEQEIEKLFVEYINEVTKGKPHGVNRIDLHKQTFKAGYMKGLEMVEKDKEDKGICAVCDRPKWTHRPEASVLRKWTCVEAYKNE